MCIRDSINGDVNQDAFEEVDDEQGKLISASVELSCGEHRQLYDFSFVVFPDELDAGERLIKGCLLYTSRCV